MAEPTSQPELTPNPFAAVPTMPATVSDDAILRVAIRRGYVNGKIKDDGGVNFYGVNDPRFWAVAKAFNRIPEKVSLSMQRDMNADSIDLVQSAATHYAYLHLASPAMADEVYKNMTPTAQLRARGMMDALDIKNPGAIDANSLVARVKEATPDVMMLKPVALTDDQARFQVFGGTTDTAKVISDATTRINKAIPAMQNHWFDGKTADPVPAYMAIEYSKIAADEYKIALAKSQSEPAAVDAAHAIAARKIAEKYPPVLWNGVVRMTPATGAQPGPQLQDAIVADLKTAYQDEHVVKSALDSYHPVWDNTQQWTDAKGVSHRGGWVLRENNPRGDLLTIWNAKAGRPLPFMSNGEMPTPSAEAMEKQAREKNAPLTVPQQAAWEAFTGANRIPG